jgi:hypothetical protein
MRCGRDVRRALAGPLGVILRAYTHQQIPAPSDNDLGALMLRAFSLRSSNCAGKTQGRSESVRDDSRRCTGRGAFARHPGRYPGSRQRAEDAFPGQGEPSSAGTRAPCRDGEACPLGTGAVARQCPDAGGLPPGMGRDHRLLRAAGGPVATTGLRPAHKLRGQSRSYRPSRIPRAARPGECRRAAGVLCCTMTSWLRPCGRCQGGVGDRSDPAPSRSCTSPRHRGDHSCLP